MDCGEKNETAIVVEEIVSRCQRIDARTHRCARRGVRASEERLRRRRVRCVKFKLFT
jgi:hypothetical protein